MEHNKYIMLKRLLRGVCQIYTLRINVATNTYSLLNIFNAVFSFCKFYVYKRINFEQPKKRQSR